MMHVQLPDRMEITLREAVTAFVYGESRDASSGPLYPSFASDALLEQLRCAAQAGRVRFRALKIGDNKYQEIESLYFCTRREFNWNENEIQSWGPADEETGVEGEVLGVDWYDVYLDREQFASLLRDMGVSVNRRDGGDVQGERKTFETGLAGRPTSIYFVLPLAQIRLDAGDYPETLAEFSKQLAEALAKIEPNAHRITPKAISNNPKLRELWRRKPPKIIDRS
jgi:hypothetical protein